MIRSTARPMPQERPSEAAMQAYLDAQAAAADRPNYARPASNTPQTAIYGNEPVEDLTNLTPRERALRMREKARAFVTAGDNDPSVNGR
jgi:hypothetical protein